MRTVVRQAVGELGQHGALVTEWTHGSIRDALDIWLAMFEEQFGRTLEDTIGQGRRLSVVEELLRWGVGRPRHTLAALLFCLGERVGRSSERAAATFAARGRQLRSDLEATLDGGVLIMPAHPRVAPRHGSALLRPLDWAYTAIWNVLEFPATSVPLGRSKAGLPLGIQIVAARDGDATAIAVARLPEESGVSTPIAQAARPGRNPKLTHQSGPICD